jgi:molybdopterin synthase sulfur carrier subunit
MPVTVRIPTPLRNLTNGQGEVQVTGDSVADLIDNIEKEHPGLKARLYDEQGQLRRFVNLYLNDEDIRFLDGPKTATKDGDVLSIIPAIAGGTR